MWPIPVFAKGIQDDLKIGDEVFRAHGLGDITGSLMKASLALPPSTVSQAAAHEFLVRLLAVVVVGAYSVLVAWLIMKTLRAMGPVRVSAEEEVRGLAIAKRAIGIHNGSLRLENVHPGLKVLIELPLPDNGTAKSPERLAV